MKTPHIISGSTKSRLWANLQKTGKSVASFAKKAVNKVVNISDAYHAFDEKTGGLLSTTGKVAAKGLALISPELAAIAAAGSAAASVAESVSRSAKEIIDAKDKPSAALKAFQSEADTIRSLTEKSIAAGAEKLPKATVDKIKRHVASFEEKRKKIVKESPELAAQFNKMGANVEEVVANLLKST